MVPLAHLWLPVLLAAAFVFIASSLIHMVFKWHNADYRALPNEDEVLEALRRGDLAPGQYAFPHCPDHRDLEKEEYRKKFQENPLGLIYLQAPGLPRMGRALGLWFLFNLGVSFFVAYLVSRTLPGGTSYLQVFRVAGTLAFLAHAAGAIPSSIWMGKPWRVTLKEVADGLLYGLITAGVFGWLWPR